MIKTKQGMASLFLAAFVTLLIGIITLSFLQIVTLEMKAASNSDLSESAYDAALAGVEDAKIALVKYQTCLSKNGQGEGCEELINQMTTGMRESSCDVVANALGRTDNGEVLIQADYEGEDDPKGLDEAYTCVKISTVSAEYSSYLSATSPSRVVPVVTEGDQYKDVVGIMLQWYSDEAIAGEIDTNEAFSRVWTTVDGTDVFRFGTADEVAGSFPTLTFDLYQSDETFSAYELDLNSENGGTDHAEIVLYPTAARDNDPYGTLIRSSRVFNASSKSASTTDTPMAVSCGYDSGYRCRAVIEFPATYRGGVRNQSTFFFRTTLPYGSPSTDFAVTLCGAIDQTTGECTQIINFNGVQAVVDSTGRASTLYRRVVAHIDLLNSGSLPEFAVQQYNGDAETIRKSFYVTKDCWALSSGNIVNCNDTGGV